MYLRLSESSAWDPRSTYREAAEVSRLAQSAGSKHIASMARYRSCDELGCRLGLQKLLGPLVYDSMIFCVFHRQTVDLRLDLPCQSCLLYTALMTTSVESFNMHLLGIAVLK